MKTPGNMLILFSVEFLVYANIGTDDTLVKVHWQRHISSYFHNDKRNEYNSLTTKYICRFPNSNGKYQRPYSSISLHTTSIKAKKDISHNGIRMQNYPHNGIKTDHMPFKYMYITNWHDILTDNHVPTINISNLSSQQTGKSIR